MESIILPILLAIAILVIFSSCVEVYLREQYNVSIWLLSRDCQLYIARDVPIFCRWYLHHGDVYDTSTRKKGISSIPMIWNLFWIRLHEKNGVIQFRKKG